MSTFDRCEPLARWTAQRIDDVWENHPPIFYSGLNRDEDASCLGYSCDDRDWMGVTLEAVEKLREKGFSHVYLILDDHPPVGLCHEQFLNEELPRVARQLNAVCIGLLGYGQHRGVEGDVLGEKEGFLERCPKNYRWKFSLHPGLWNLEELQKLLQQRRAIYHEGERTAWNFESQYHDDHQDPHISSMLERCFRVSGTHFLKKYWRMRFAIVLEMIERFLVDVILFGVKKLRGGEQRALVEKKELWRYGHYLGPYPLFWSGAMQKGKPSVGWERWLQRKENRLLQQSWQLFYQKNLEQ